MEEQNRYYTPDISELHVGYECEHTSNMSAFICEDYDDVVKDKLTSTDLKWYITWGEEEGGLKKFVRTKYLDKSDIESCGWTCQEYSQDGYNQSYTKNVDSESGYDLIYCAAWDKKWQIDDCGEGIYWGEIKSINELRQIMKWLKIK